MKGWIQAVSVSTWHRKLKSSTSSIMETELKEILRVCSVLLLLHRVRNTFVFIIIQSFAWWTDIRTLPLTGMDVSKNWQNSRKLYDSITRILRMNSRHCEKNNDIINKKYFSRSFTVFWGWPWKRTLKI